MGAAHIELTEKPDTGRLVLSCCRYSLDCIVTKLKETSEVMIHSIVVYMNLRKKLRLLLRSLFSWLRIAVQNQLEEADLALA